MSGLEISSEEFKDYIVHDVFDFVDDLITRKMFGGYGLYLPDEQYGKVMFGGIADGRLFLRSDDEHKDALVAMGCEQFIYHGHKDKKPSIMPWWFIPEEVLENKDALEVFVWEGFEIARKYKKPKSK